MGAAVGAVTEGAAIGAVAEGGGAAAGALALGAAETVLEAGAGLALAAEFVAEAAVMGVGEMIAGAAASAFCTIQ